MGKKKKKRKKKSRAFQSTSKPKVVFSERPPMSEMGAPHGFRSLSISQAMVEYVKPLMDYSEGTVESLNDIMMMSTMLWNYTTLSEEKGEDEKIKAQIVKAFHEKLKLEQNEAQKMVKEMIDRYHYLFPRDIKPENRLFMFIRKETPTIISPFDYSTLTISHDIIEPNEEDRALISKINQLDRYMNYGAGYEEYEQLLHTLMDDTRERFGKWLKDKELVGEPERVEIFSSCIEPYLNFIYGYTHPDILILKSMPLIYLTEFFEDFLIRKIMVDNPNEYVDWMPALKLFNRFLYEKEYCERPDEIIEELDTVEPFFIEVLQRQFT